jgi:hypothetical protein
MDILKFQAKPVKENFHGLNITFNADAFTPEFFRNAAAKFRELREITKADDEAAAAAMEKAVEDRDMLEQTALNLESEARFQEAKRDIWSIMLIPVLMEWDLTRVEKGKEVAVPLTEDEIKKLKPALVEQLYTFCLEKSRPKEPEIPTIQTSPTISESTDAGSSLPEIQPAESPTM